MKKYKTTIRVALACLIVFSTIVSCKKDYLDVNENPNFPADVTVVELLPSAEAAIAHAIGNNYQIFGGLWGQYWTQSPSSSQYKTIEQYSPGANDFDRPWRIMYSDALQDLNLIISKATADNKPNYVACAKILQAYAFQELTDNFGDIPFTEALQGEEGILTPRYDSQENVYNGIFNLLAEADALIDESSDFHPGDEDFFFLGDMAGWRSFGNTIKLRAYLRLAYVNPGLAQSGITALGTAGATFIAEEQSVQLNYSGEPGNTNPLYSSIVGLSLVQNLVASSTGIDYVLNHNDVRLDALYTPAANGSQVGIPQGAFDVSASTPVSFPGTMVGGYGDDGASALATASASAPVKLLTSSESLFLQAEAVVRGWMAGDAQALYESAIIESFASYGFSIADTDSVVQIYLALPDIIYPAAAPMEDQIKAIITQKWVALNGISGTEGWTEWRRTGYPDFFVESANSLIGAGRMPQRFFYPNDEVTRNPLNNPGQKLIYEKVWWDVN